MGSKASSRNEPTKESVIQQNHQAKHNNMRQQHLAEPSIDGKKAVSCEAQPETWSTLIAPGVPHATRVVLLQRCKALRGWAGHEEEEEEENQEENLRHRFGTRVTADLQDIFAPIWDDVNAYPAPKVQVSENQGLQSFM